MKEIELFEHSPLTTPDLYDEPLDAMLEPVAEKVVYPDKYIFSSPGERLNFIYYIKSGRTKHYMGNEDGGTKILYALTPGWFFGETPFFLQCPTGLYSQTETKTVLYKIPADQCHRLMEESDRFRNTIIRCYAHKMLILRYEIANLTFNSCKNRLKRLFYASIDSSRIPDPGWYSLKIRYTQSELGEIVGGSRVTISRQLNELCNEGTLRMINRRIQVNIEKYLEYSALQEKENSGNAYENLYKQPK